MLVEPIVNRSSRLKSRYRRTGNPILSVDSKRKEWVGPLQRDGTVLADGPAEVLDHKLPSYAKAEVTPHGIYDLKRNTGHVNLTAGSDTGEFACASLQWYWRHIGSAHYPEADSLLLLCDCGGSNSHVSNAFKFHLARLASKLGLSIEVAHYPVHCSKYNPIEHRLFCHVESSFAGRVFSSVPEMAQAAREAVTRTGLQTTAHVIKKHYTPVARSGAKLVVPDHAIAHDKNLPDYNYTLSPGKPDSS